jgi:hypothetical protein
MFTDHTATMHLAYLLGGPYCKDGVNGFSVGRIHAAEYMFYRYILNQSIHTSLLHRSHSLEILNISVAKPCFGFCSCTKFREKKHAGHATMCRDTNCANI